MGIKWNLKEAVGNTLAWGTRITYKTIQSGWVCHPKRNPILPKDYAGDVGDIGVKAIFLN